MKLVLTEQSFKKGKTLLLLRNWRYGIPYIPNLLFLFSILLAATFLLSVPTAAQAGECVLDGDTYVCSGEFPDGLTVNAQGFTTLDLADVLGQIDPDGEHGVYYYSSTGSQLTLIAGEPNTELAISTNGNDNYGLVAESLGTSSGISTIPALDLRIPSTGSTPGGAVTVENYASITTTGKAAYGLRARNKIGGYNKIVRDSLETFEPDAHAYEVTTVNDLAENVGEQVEGTNGGMFTINAVGTFDFDPGDIFDNLEDGEEFSTAITYYVSANGHNFTEATLTITRTQDRDSNFDTFTSVSFDEYNVAGVTGDDEPPLFPDMQAYVDQLRADAGIGGVAEAIIVINAGHIETWGIDSHGIVARTVSGSGRAGVDGNFWGRKPTAGRRGTNGGGIEVVNDGEIITHGKGSAGIVATSRGGTGGEGGEGSTWRYGKAGGEGGTGGNVFASGDGSIHTYGDNASGVLALSVGGVGGLGGEGVGFTGGALGGTGGDAGIVMITGNMDITTEGLASHGIWARSVGGSGGRGGSAGWIGTASGGGGGAAADGGLVTIMTGGEITTLENFSHGIFGQSIGGFGGTGGQSVSLFAAFGGDGGSAGIGGEVDIVNLETGDIWTDGYFSHGILAQSIGGGGGDGGTGVAMGVGVGGAGGAGGHGGAVNVTNQGLITTNGAWSRGIYAQSIGGGGGDGGMSIGIVGIGGSGSGGGNADAVYVVNRGLIDTGGNYGYGIMAQSIGGGGGDGGFSGGLVSLGGSGAAGGIGALVDVDNYDTILTSGEWAHSIFAQSIGGGGGSGGGSFGTIFTLGGSGGEGQDAGNVDIFNEGWLTTEGLGAQGIHAESIGGGGGSGGSSVATSISIGGSGGNGGLGGAVKVTNAGDILTKKDMSQGIFGMSVGGGGGNGGSAGSMFVSVGGTGGDGTDGGDVNIQNSGTLTTLGSNSTGVFAQSVGGSGGNGGDATTVQIAPVVSLSFSLGGDAGDGGDGGDVLVGNTNTGLIETYGSNSHAVFAQSVGGSGGSGGSATTISAVISIPGVKIPTITANIAIGGRGATGGEAGEVEVDNDGTITTSDFRSYGVYAQSVGGSGGDGGNATNIQLAIDAAISASVAIGGDAGNGGIGNRVTVDNTGLIHTLGDHSTGVFAQSVGGGGGTGGDATTVKISLTPPPTSPADFIPTPSMSFDLAVGGDGGTGGIGGNVEAENVGTIITEGNFATGIMAQSVGGSGGTGGDARIISVDLSADPMDFVPLLDLMSFSTTMVFGGTGGDGGHGGNIIVTHEAGENDGIQTLGAFSHGIVAQSVGGGGGSGGSAMTFEFSNTDLPVDIPILDDISGLTTIEMTLQGSSGAGGDGGDVTLNSDGNIWTSGDFAMGVVAQSIAGGGGLAGFYNPHGITNSEIVNTVFNMLVDTDAGLSFAGSVGGAGTAGDVIVDHSGDIQTFGDGAHGLFAQSAAGQGAAGDVDITLNGNIHTFGDSAFAIYAQSGGSGGNGDISVTIDDGIVMGGSGMGSGLFIAAGNSNSVWNSGLITSQTGIDGYAIRATGGDEFIDNYGTVTGNVSLGAGTNVFNNQQGAIFNAGATVDLGSDNLLNNAGTLSPGGSGNVFSTAINGNLLQTGSGSISVDIDSSTGKTDHLSASGTADLAGVAALSILNPGRALPGTHQSIIVAGAGGVTDSGLSLDYRPSAVVTYSLLYPNPTDVVLSAVIDFSPKRGLNRNQQALGKAINSIQRGGGTDRFAPIADRLSSLPDVKSIAKAYARLSPESYGASTLATFKGNQQYTKTLVKRIHSIRSYLDTEGLMPGTRQVLPHGVWSDGFITSGDQDTDNSFTGFDYKTGGFGIGFDKLFNDGLLGGISYGQSHTNVDIDSDGGDGDIDSYLFSLYGSLFSDKYYLDVALSYGKESYKSHRNIEFGALNRRAVSDHDGDLYSAYSEAGYNIEMDKLIVQPFAALQYSYLDEESYRESGAGALNLVVDGRETDSLVSDLGLRFNRPFAKDDLVFIPEVSVAWRHDFNIDDRHINAAFEGAPDVSFTTENNDMDDGILIGIGATVMNRSGMSMYVRYDDERRGDFTAQRISAGMRFEF